MAKKTTFLSTSPRLVIGDFLPLRSSWKQINKFFSKMPLFERSEFGILRKEKFVNLSKAQHRQKITNNQAGRKARD